MNAATIEKEALSLDIKSRAHLAARLLQSLDELTEEENERLWADEALRRDDEINEGRVSPVAVDDVISELRSRIS